jgi:signal transduction histidine kinase
MLQTAGSRLAVEVPEGLQIPGERDAVTRILRNLLENAVKYGPAGQTVRLSAVPAGTTVRLAVEDQGPGIPPEDRSRIWRPYQRLERDRNAPVGGSGLGLSVVSELTAAMGGRAYVEDAPGGGARFVIELPQGRPVRAGAI